MYASKTIESVYTSTGKSLLANSNQIKPLGQISSSPSTTTYEIDVYRDLPSSLSNLTISAGHFTQPFEASMKDYYVDVENPVEHISLTPTIDQSTGLPLAAITINEQPVESGIGSTPIPLDVGDNIIEVVVTAPVVDDNNNAMTGKLPYQQPTSIGFM